MGVSTAWDSEGEAGRYLIELGTLGYILFWMTRLGLAVALVRASTLAKSAGNLSLGGLALAFAILPFLGGNLTFDHVYQALYSVGVGLILRDLIMAASAPVVCRLQRQFPLDGARPT